MSMAEKIREAKKEVSRKAIDRAFEKELNELGINLDSKESKDKPTRANEDVTHSKTPEENNQIVEQQEMEMVFNDKNYPLGKISATESKHSSDSFDKAAFQKQVQ